MPKNGRKSSSAALQSQTPEYQCAGALFTLLSVFFGNRQNRIAGKQVIYGYEEILRNRFQRIDALRVRKETEEALYGGFMLKTMSAGRENKGINSDGRRIIAAILRSARVYRRGEDEIRFRKSDSDRARRPADYAVDLRICV